MNSHDAKSGLKLAFTTAGTVIGGPIGGAIGNALGTLAGKFVPEKTFMNQKTVFNENVDANMGYSRKDFGTGFKNYFSEEREKATTFSKVANIASDAIPAVSGISGFKGLINTPLKSIGGDVASKLSTQSMPELGAKMGSDLVSKAPIGLEKIASKTMSYVPDLVSNTSSLIEKQKTTNTEVSNGIEYGDSSVNPNIKSRVESQFDALNFDDTVNNVMKNIEGSPFKMFEETKINGTIQDYSSPKKLNSIQYIPSVPSIDTRNTPGTNAIDMISSEKNIENQNKISSVFNDRYVSKKNPIEGMNSFSFKGLKTYPSILGTDKEYDLEKIRNASGIFTPYNNTYFK